MYYIQGNPLTAGDWDTVVPNDNACYFPFDDTPEPATPQVFICTPLFVCAKQVFDFLVGIPGIT